MKLRFLIALLITGISLADGQLVASESHTTTGRSSVELNFHGYAKGVYLVRVKSESGVQTIRLVLM